MGFFKSLLGLEKKSSDNSLVNFLSGGGSDVESMSPEQMYYKAAIAFACVKKICDEASTYSFIVKDASGKPLEGLNYPIYNLLFSKSLALGGQTSFSHLLQNTLLKGEGYLLRAPYGSKTAPVSLVSIFPDRVSKNTQDSDYINGYHVTHRGQSIYIPVDILTNYSDLLRISLYSPNSYIDGISPMEAVGIEGTMINEGMKWNTNSIKNGAKPSGLFTTPDGTSLTPDQISQLKELQKEVYSGAKNARSNMIVPGGLKYQPISLSPSDMDFNKSIRLASENVAHAFGVPLPLLFNDASTNDNITQMTEQFTQKTVLPMVRHIIDTYSMWFKYIDKKELKLCVDVNSIPSLEANKERKHNKLVKGIEGGLYTINEARNLLDLPNISDPLADDILVKSSMTSLSFGGGRSRWQYHQRRYAGSGIGGLCRFAGMGIKYQNYYKKFSTMHRMQHQKIFYYIMFLMELFLAMRHRRALRIFFQII